MKIIIAMIALFVVGCSKSPDIIPIPAPPNPIPPKIARTMIGTLAKTGMQYQWSPTDTLSDPTAAQPVAFPTKSTLYTVFVKSQCGSATSSVLVRVYKKNQDGELVEVK